MESTSKLLERAAATVIFGIALAVLIISARELSRLTAEMKEKDISQSTIYAQSIDNTYEGVTYEEVISQLLSDISYDIQIGDYSIACNQYDISELELSRIEYRNYQKSYEYDATGQIVKVIYQ